MKIRANTFKQAVAAGVPQIGIWNSLCSNIAADAMAPAGYDWTVLDMEHSPDDIRTVLGQLQAYQSGPTVPIVRPAWNDAVLVKQLLDLGAPGLLFPMVQSIEEAKQAVAATRYPPRGIRGVSVAQRGNRFGRIDDYFGTVEAETCVLVQIETQAALERVGEIAAVDGVNGVFFGPADLAADMGLLSHMGSETLWSAITEGAEIARQAGMPSGTLVGNSDKAVEMFGKGMTYVACSSDLNLMVRAADTQLNAGVAGREDHRHALIVSKTCKPT